VVTYIAARSHIASCTSQRPDPRGFDHGPGLAIGSGQEVVQWPTVTLARKRQNCGYDQGTGSGVFQVGQRGARLNERQPAVPVLGGLLAYPFKAADPRVTFSRGDEACNPERAGRALQAARRMAQATARILEPLSLACFAVPPFAPIGLPVDSFPARTRLLARAFLAFTRRRRTRRALQQRWPE
jgi:hypothetical protein